MPTLLASEWVKARISKSWYIDTSHMRAEHVAGVNHSDLTHLGNGRQVKQNKKQLLIWCFSCKTLVQMHIGTSEELSGIF